MVDMNDGTGDYDEEILRLRSEIHQAKKLTAALARKLINLEIRGLKYFAHNVEFTEEILSNLQALRSEIYEIIIQGGSNSDHKVQEEWSPIYYDLDAFLTGVDIGRALGK